MQSVLDGYNGTLMAYGQTGTGKTHTMLGPPLPAGTAGAMAPTSGDWVTAPSSTPATATGFGSFGPPGRGFGGPSASMRPMSRAGGAPSPADAAGDDDDDALPAILAGAAREERGLIPRALDHIFNAISRDTEHSYDVSVSFVQIYCELVHDLLTADPTAKNLLLREDADGGVYVEGVTRCRVADSTQCLQLLAQGHRNRATAKTRYVVRLTYLRVGLIAVASPPIRLLLP